MITVVPFLSKHLLTLTPQPEQRAEWLVAAQAGLEGNGWSVQQDGKTLACGVLIALGDGRAAVMAFIGSDAGPHMAKIIRAADRAFEMSVYSRIEATVVARFDAGARLMRILGFELETPNGMRRFGPNGETHMLYARLH